MNIKLELLKNAISDLVTERICDLEIDADKITNTKAIEMLAEIQRVIADDEYTDFDAVEEIVKIFEKNKLDFGSRHDF